MSAIVDWHVLQRHMQRSWIIFGDSVPYSGRNNLFDCDCLCLVVEKVLRKLYGDFCYHKNICSHKCIYLYAKDV